VVTAAPEPRAEWRPPPGLALAYYLRQALAIARLQDAAIAAASLDKRAIWYGLLIWLVGEVLTLAGELLRALAGSEIDWFAVSFVILVLIGSMGH